MVSAAYLALKLSI